MFSEAESQLRKLDLQTFNYLLYRCEAEEQSEYGQGAYAVPEFEKLVYCGLQGIQTVLKRIQETDDLGHPVCSNLRAGNWIVDYTVARMKRLPELTDLAKMFENTFGLLTQGVPHFLRPAYFELIFSYFYKAVENVLSEKLL